ncbi:hypothetical protein AB0C98_26725 [Streptomyces sp. NPDC048558]|uniref:hypothetical protein n=1 Tax=Streptomyces sp. NPDC048558 TaxID=3155759 RepID=UPI0034260294
MDQGIAGILGAAVGGLIGVTGTVGAASRTGKDQRRTQHEHWRRQQRRDAYAQLIARTSEGLRTGQEAFDALLDEEDDYARKVSAFAEAAKALYIGESTVALEGPEEVAEAARELVGDLLHWANSMSLVILLTENPGAGANIPSSASIEGQALRAHEALADFTILCRKLLDE